jgi:2'-5' RNA ligase
LGKMIEEYKDYDLGVVRAGSIIVFESRLTPQGPLYTPLGTYKLQER